MMKKMSRVAAQHMRRAVRLRAVTIPMLMAFTACSPNVEAFAEKHTTAEERTFADSYFSLILDGEIDSAIAMIHPRLASETGLYNQLEESAGLLARADFANRRLIGVQSHQSNDGRIVNFSWVFPAGNEWLVANVASQWVDSDVVVVGLSANMAAESPIVANEFTVENKSLAQLSLLPLLPVVFLFCLVTCVVMVRSKGMKRRYLWAFVALLSAPVILVDWTSGAFELRLLHTALFGAGMMKGGPANPWVLQLGFPLGASWAWFKWNRWKRIADQGPVESPQSNSVK